MYEPKYKLNRKDRVRFHELAVKEALGKATMQEKVELEKLSRERSRRLWRHPKMQSVKRFQRARDRKLRALCAKIDALIDQSPKLRRAFGKSRFMDAFKSD